MLRRKVCVLFVKLVEKYFHLRLFSLSTQTGMTGQVFGCSEGIAGNDDASAVEKLERRGREEVGQHAQRKYSPSAGIMPPPHK